MPEYERLDAEGTALPSGAIYALGLTPGRETWGLEPWDLGDLTPDWLEYVEIERPWFYALPRSRHTWEDGSRPLRRRPWFDTFINLIFVGAVLQLGHLLLTAFMECGGHQKAVGSALFPGGGGVAHGGEDATSYNFDHTITPTFDEAWYGTTPGKCASWCSPRHMTSHCARSDCFGCGFCLDSPPPYAPPPRRPPQTPPPAPPPAPGALPDPGLCVGLLSGVLVAAAYLATLFSLWTLGDSYHAAIVVDSSPLHAAADAAYLVLLSATCASIRLDWLNHLEGPAKASWFPRLAALCFGYWLLRLLDGALLGHTQGVRRWCASRCVDVLPTIAVLLLVPFRSSPLTLALVGIPAVLHVWVRPAYRHLRKRLIAGPHFDERRIRLPPHPDEAADSWASFLRLILGAAVLQMVASYRPPPTHLPPSYCRALLLLDLSSNWRRQRQARHRPPPWSPAW